MVNWIDEPQPLDIGNEVTHLFFGDGKIDQRRDMGSAVTFHVNFVKVSAWIPACDLKRIAADEAADVQAVANLQRAAGA